MMYCQLAKFSYYWHLCIEIESEIST